MYFTKLGGKHSTVLTTIFYVLQEMSLTCDIGNDKITLSGQISLYLQILTLTFLLVPDSFYIL